MQADLPTLTALLERVEKAEGPDRELDTLLVKALLPSSPGAAFVPPDYTYSIDEALKLTERMMVVEWPCYEVHARMIHDSRGWWHFWEITVPSREFQGRAKSPALALLQCLLRALIAQANKEVVE